MKIVLQRVKKASVTVDGKVVGAIAHGLLLLVGVHASDRMEDIDWLVQKVVNMRIFNDEKGVMNKSVLDVQGDLLIVSQFTLMARTNKGNRPSYTDAAGPDFAIPMYEQVKTRFANAMGHAIQAGIFGADMQVELINDGPVTILLDTANKI